MARHGNGIRRARHSATARPRPLTRRGVVAGALGVAGASAIGAGLTRPGGGFAEPGVWAAAQETDSWLPRIPELSSENGLLNLTLVAMGDESRGQTALGYALSLDPTHPDSVARSPGPTLRLRRRDRLRIRLVNHLDRETNLHVHGLHVWPGRNSDNVFVHVDPLHGDGAFDFAYQIPENHRSGLFWYHPHLHGTTQDQVEKGLAGAIIIEESEEDPAAFRDEPPVVKGVPERLLVLQHLILGPRLFHVNGRLNPDIRFVPGERERWRLLNASSDTFLNLYLDGLEFHRIAVDGNWLDRAVPATILPLGPAERAEVVIDWGFQQSYTLSALDPGNTPVFESTAPKVALATLLRDDAAALFGATPVPRLAPADLLPLPDLRAIPAVPERVLDFQFKLNGGMLVIDDKLFSAGRVDQTVELEGLEQWTIHNTSPGDFGWHPLHIHVNDFQVVSITGNQLQPVWYTDTVPLPPGGHVVIRAEFPDFTGKFVYHCHFLEHEDAGMMGVIEVVQPVRIDGGALSHETVTVTAGPTIPHAVNSGASVVWTNLEENERTIVADDVDLLTGQPLFASGPLRKGASFAHTFEAPGVFTYQCSSGNDATLSGAIDVVAEQTVEILDFAFQPATVTVAAGTTVTWTNRDPATHTVTADDLDGTGSPVFDTGPLRQGDVGRHTFAAAGDFPYHCDIHSGMTGAVNVRPVTRQSVSIGINDDGLDRPDIEVFKDSTVTWMNRGSTACSVDVAGTVNSGVLDAERLYEPGKALSPGQRFSHAFTAVGTFPFAISTEEPAPTQSGTITVVQPVGIVNFGDLALEPREITIPVGAEVVWLNQDAIAHTIIVNSTAPDGDQPVFDSGPFGPGEVFRHAFTTAGVFAVHASAHPDQLGTVTVT